MTYAYVQGCVADGVRKCGSFKLCSEVWSWEMNWSMALRRLRDDSGPWGGSGRCGSVLFDGYDGL